MVRHCNDTPARRARSMSHGMYRLCSQMMVVKHQPWAYLQAPAKAQRPVDCNAVCGNDM